MVEPPLERPKSYEETEEKRIAELFRLINPFTFKILKLLSDEDMKYSDLKEHFSNDGTLSKWIKELEAAKWICSYDHREEKRKYSYYKLTERGQWFMEIMKSIVVYDK